MKTLYLGNILGATGPVGATGPIGPAGVGLDGAMGETGATGPCPCDDGATGPVGVTGPSGPIGPGYLGSSSDFIDLSDSSTATGQTVSLTTQAGLGYEAGVVVKVFDAASTIPSVLNYLLGVVTLYSNTSLEFVVIQRVGISSGENWKINLAGEMGPAGPAGQNLEAIGENNELLFNNNGTVEGTNYLFYDDENRRLGINKIQPSHPLEVEGTAKVSSLIVEEGISAKNIAVAWVNFNGETISYETSADPIRSSFNVSSITDLAAGQYKINLETPAKSNDSVVISTAHANSPGYGSDGINRMSSANMEDEYTATVNVWKTPGIAFQGTLSDAQTVSAVVFSDVGESESTLPSVDPHWEDVILLLQSNATTPSQSFLDLSNRQQSVDAVGHATHSTTQSKWTGSSIYFDGVGDSLLVGSANDSVWDFGAGDWTMEAWVRPTLNKQTIIGKWDTTGTTDNSFIFWIGPVLGSGTGHTDSTFNRIEGFFNNNCGATGAGVTLVGDTGLALNEWQHVAVQRRGNAIELYVQGYFDTSEPFVGSLCECNQPVHIGDFGDWTPPQSPGEYKGWMDDIRITKGQARYNPDTGNNIPITSHPTT